MPLAELRTYTLTFLWIVAEKYADRGNYFTVMPQLPGTCRVRSLLSVYVCCNWSNISPQPNSQGAVLTCSPCAFATLAVRPRVVNSGVFVPASLSICSYQGAMLTIMCNLAPS